MGLQCKGFVYALSQSENYKAPNLQSADHIIQKDPLTTIMCCNPT